MPRTILLADDSVTIRKVVELTFSDTDIRVESVASGREAIERLTDLRPDLVLADVVMPGPSGYEVCRAVKASDRPVPVLLLTGTFEPFDPELAKECGSDGHVTKPFDSRSLVDRVEALLARPGGRPSGPAEDDLEAIFDDLASPERAEVTDAPPAPAPVATEPEPVDRAAPQGGPAASDAPRGGYEGSDDGDALRMTAEPEETDSEETLPAAIEADAGDAAVAGRSSGATTLSPADIDAIARAVVERLSERVLREIAWDVVPDLAETLVRERLRELEREDRESS